MTHKQVLIIRKDLKMRRGKEISQASHASLGAILKQGSYHKAWVDDDNEVITPPQLIINLDERTQPWLQGIFKKITVYVNSEQELFDLQKAAQEKGLIECLIQDSGLTEFGGVPTYTCLAIGPDLEEKINEITGGLPLY